MMNPFKLAALLPCIFFALSLVAQPLSKTDKADIEAQSSPWGKVFETWYAPALEPFFAENAEMVTPQGTIIRGRSQIIDMFSGLFQYFKTLPKADRTEKAEINKSERYLAPDVVLMTFVEESTSYFGTDKRVESMAHSIIFRKINGKWLAEHVTITPVTREN